MSIKHMFFSAVAVALLSLGCGNKASESVSTTAPAAANKKGVLADALFVGKQD